jgi:hypothetical protein
MILFFVLLICFFVFGTIWIRQAATGISASPYQALTLFSLGLAVLMQLITRIHTLRWLRLDGFSIHNQPPGLAAWLKNPRPHRYAKRCGLVSGFVSDAG